MCQTLFSALRIQQRARQREDLESQACRVRARRDLRANLIICSGEKPEAEKEQEKPSCHRANREPSLESWKVKDNGLRGHLSLTAQFLEAETSGQRQESHQASGMGFACQ